jgi:hypothetical protein
MNFEIIEGRQTRNKVVKFRGVGIVDNEVIFGKDKGGGVGVVAEKHWSGGFSVVVLGEEGEEPKLG